MDESAEQIATAKAGRLCWLRRVAAVRREQLESAVWPVLVVVVAVDAKHPLEMAADDDEDPIEAVSANRAHPTLGEGVCVRRLDRTQTAYSGCKAKSTPPEGRLDHGDRSKL